DDAGFRFGREPVTLSDNFIRMRERLLEACADEDPEILAALVERTAIPAARLRSALRRGTVSGRLVPVLSGSAYKNRGVQPLLDAVVAYLPSPRDREAGRAADGSETRAPSRDVPLSALAFKVVFDDHGQ